MYFNHNLIINYFNFKGFEKVNFIIDLLLQSLLEILVLTIEKKYIYAVCFCFLQIKSEIEKFNEKFGDRFNLFITYCIREYNSIDYVKILISQNL